MIELTDSHPFTDAGIAGRSRDWVAGGGEMGALVRSLDWSKTALGPLDGWPQSLRTIVSTCLSSRFPILIWWGAELVMIYNDALSMIIGNKHPRAMGQRGAEGWWEVWHVLGPMLMSVLSDGASTWSENQRLDIERSLESGSLEETYFTFSYSPIRDESGGVGGVFCAVTETTAQVLSERRLRTLSALAQHTAEVRTAGEACLRAAVALEGNAADVPVAFLYLAEGDGQSARLASAVGVTFPSDWLDNSTRADWPLGSVLETGNPLVVDDAGVRRAFEAMGCQAAAPLHAALLLPFGGIGKPGPSGVLVVGLAPLLLLDDQYRSFLVLVAGHIGTAIASAHALEAAEQRAEALAQIDRAKTAFFSNVSHEFRTPLTLMLGPTEDALASNARALSGADLETVHRNELRLLRLVNTLLDFSRIEAGRADAAFEPTDLSALTRDFAAAFRSAIERAGLAFEVDCEPLGEEIYVDRDMWEKIVLNLLSNALKFTFDGSIGVALRVRADVATLVIRDSGVGIAAAELPRVFDRFHRIEGTRSRTHEGTGIGLALVRDLVRLHGGDIVVESREGAGTTFTVSIPTGTAHLPTDRLRAPTALPENGVRDQSFVTEAMRWLPREDDDAPSRPALDSTDDAGSTLSSPRILLVDDNADMREYVARLLRQHWSVDTAADGVEALAMTRRAVPSLVLTDVMMPNLDGFGLLHALRDDPRTHSVPVVMLSARAGEESRVEGLTMGADDYLIKPFSAKELVARVTTHLELGQLRRAAETERNRLHSLFEQAPAAIVVMRGPSLVFELANPRAEELLQRRNIVGKTVAEVFPEFEDQAFPELLRRVYTTGERFVGREMLVKLVRTAGGEPEELYFDFIYDPIRTAEGTVEGITSIFFEVTERVRSAQERERLLVERQLLLRNAEDARAEAEVANRAKSEFLAIMSHELRTPLNAIGGYAELIELGIRGPVTPEQRMDLARIQTSKRHLLGLINGVLNYARVEAGAVNFTIGDVALDEVLATCEALTAPQLRARGLTLTYSDRDAGLHAQADAQKVQQIVLNLLTNAIKFTEPGGRIEMSCRGMAGSVQVSIRDTGCGIAPEHVARVFEPFVQVDSRLTRTSDGVGLGLAISRDLTRRMQGDLTVESVPRVGSTFTLTLPRAE